MDHSPKSKSYKEAGFCRKTGKYLNDLKCKQIALKQSGKNPSYNEEIDNLDFIKYKNLGSSKDIIEQARSNLWIGRRDLNIICLPKDLQPEHKLTPTNQ